MGGQAVGAILGGNAHHQRLLRHQDPNALDGSPATAFPCGLGELEAVRNKKAGEHTARKGDHRLLRRAAEIHRGAARQLRRGRLREGRGVAARSRGHRQHVRVGVAAAGVGVGECRDVECRPRFSDGARVRLSRAAARARADQRRRHVLLRGTASRPAKSDRGIRAGSRAGRQFFGRQQSRRGAALAARVRASRIAVRPGTAGRPRRSLLRNCVHEQVRDAAGARRHGGRGTNAGGAAAKGRDESRCPAARVHSALRPRRAGCRGGRRGQYAHRR
jgi:hypothetical protein